MYTLNAVIAENLKRLRKEKKLSLENVAKLSGVSKSMLGQIERCEVNPTVSTMWKIANGLRISFTQFIQNTETDVEVVDIAHISPLLEDEGRAKIYPVFPFDLKRRFEVYSLVIEPSGFLSTEPHLLGTQEFVTVYSGELSIDVREQEYIIPEGSSIRFRADAAHSYRNTQNTACSLMMIIYYPAQ